MQEFSFFLLSSPKFPLGLLQIHQVLQGERPELTMRPPCTQVSSKSRRNCQSNSRRAFYKKFTSSSQSFPKFLTKRAPLRFSLALTGFLLW